MRDRRNGRSCWAVTSRAPEGLVAFFGGVGEAHAEILQSAITKGKELAALTRPLKPDDNRRGHVFDRRGHHSTGRLTRRSAGLVFEEAAPNWRCEHRHRWSPPKYVANAQGACPMKRALAITGLCGPHHPNLCVNALLRESRDRAGLRTVSVAGKPDFAVVSIVKSALIPP